MATALPLAGLDIAGPSAPWVAIGFAAGDGAARVGHVDLRFSEGEGHGLTGWSLAGRGGLDEVDGVPTAWVEEVGEGPPPGHANGPP
jgi:hypothetical protein